jgi:hypothetical protein
MPKYLTLSLLLAGVSMSALASDTPTLTLTARDGSFQPKVLEVQAGKRFRILVRNEGRQAMEFESHALRKEKVVAAGREAIITIAPLKAGEYAFVDEFHEATAKGRVIAR